MSANAAFARFNPTPTQERQMRERAVPDSAIAHGTQQTTCQMSERIEDKVTVQTVTAAMSVLPTSRGVDCPNSPGGHHACQACQMAGVSYCIFGALPK